MTEMIGRTAGGGWAPRGRSPATLFRVCARRDYIGAPCGRYRDSTGHCRNADGYPVFRHSVCQQAEGVGRWLI